jgi:hypothetical protein
MLCFQIVTTSDSDNRVTVTDAFFLKCNTRGRRSRRLSAEAPTPSPESRVPTPEGVRVTMTPNISKITPLLIKTFVCVRLDQTADGQVTGW